MELLIVFVAKYVLYLLILFAAVLVLLAKRTDKKRLLAVSVIAFPLSYVTAKILGTLYSNPRPFVAEHIQPLFAHNPDNGFPSDHTLLGMTIAAVIFTYNKKMGVVFAAIAMSIGLARVLAHVHHTLDILGSCVIAIAAVSVAWQLVKRITWLKV